MRWLRNLIGTIISLIVRAFRWVRVQILWLWAQVRRLLSGIFGPPWEALCRVMRGLRSKVEDLIDWIVDIIRRLWRPGGTGDRVREKRVGANGAPLLAALTLAATWYLLPIARWLGYGPFRFVVGGLVLWTIFLIAWLSRCRADRKGRVARFAQGVARSTGLRRVDQLGLLLSFVLAYLVIRQIQLLPLAFACVVAFVALLVIELEPRPELALGPAPLFPATEDGGPDVGEGGSDAARSGRWIDRRLSWAVTAHGRVNAHEVHLRIDALSAEAAAGRNPVRSAEVTNLVDWVLQGTGPEVVDLAKQIHDACFAGAYSLFATVSCFVAACQSIPYRTDEDTKGLDDYWRYPIETLADGWGDCEDSAVLLAALLRRSGFRCALLIMPGHAAVGVEVPHDVPGAYFEREGVRYYYCETTDKGWVAGMVPPEVDTTDVTFIPVPEWEEAK